MESFSSSVSTVLSFEDVFTHTTCRILFWSCYSTSRLAAFFEPHVDEIDLAKIALSCHVILLLICSATKKVHMVQHDATLGTIARGVCLLWYGTLARTALNTRRKGSSECWH